MDRRHYLKLIGAAGGLGGLGWYVLQGDSTSPDTPSNNSTATPTATTTTPSETTSTVTPPTDDAPLLAEYAQFTDYSRDQVSVNIPAGAVDASNYPNGAKVTILLGNYGDEQSFTKVGESGSFTPPSTGDLTLDIGVDTESFANESPLAYLAIISNAVDKYKWGVYLAQTDRFVFTTSGVDRRVRSFQKAPLNAETPTATYRRGVGEGTYVIQLRGATAGTPWLFELPVGKSQYATNVSKARADTAPPNEVIQALLGTPSEIRNFSLALNAVLQETGFEDETRLRFFADLVRALANVPGVRSGYQPPRKYIRQTLVDGGGDIEDVALVLAGLTIWAGYSTALFYINGHVAVGVQGNFSGFSQSINGNEYYYLEPTSAGGGVGDAPSKVKKYPTRIEELDGRS